MHELSYFTLRTEKSVGMDEIFQGAKMSKKIIAGVGEVMLRLCPPGRMCRVQAVGTGNIPRLESCLSGGRLTKNILSCQCVKITP